MTNGHELTITARKKGEKYTMQFLGKVYVLDDETQHDFIEVSPEELGRSELDLCRIPVVTIGGRAARVAGA